ncbi:MAG TPA: NupC/NupG family nucleoside CNT transporter, partial [Bacteroidetes bacterium]|nr:NupC/NupG family nucleoside CNT transporter [Bacteroidota bacterium]
MDILRGILGLAFLVGVCVLFSKDRKAIDWKLVISGLGLQVIFAILVLRTPFVYQGFQWVSNFFVQIIQFTDAGASFVLGNWPASTQVIDGDANTIVSVGFIFIFKVLPTIIFFSALTSLLY